MDGTLNDLYELDLQFLRWNKISTFGPRPSPRQGHQAKRHGNQLLIMGGCDYNSLKCYNDIYSLDVDTLVWKIIS